MRQFIESHSDAELQDDGKVRCTVTSHDMPAKLDVLTAHWSGNKYKVRKAQSKYDFAAHEPWIVPHKKDANLLYCTLTRHPISRQPKSVEAHTKGKRYQRLLLEQLSGGKKRAAHPKALLTRARKKTETWTA